MSTADGGAARAVIDLEPIGADLFRSRHTLDNLTGAIFGGQVLGQAVAAAQRTVEGWPIHNLTGYFLRGGSIDVPVDYAVTRLRDGRRYAARRVVATQAGRTIFEGLCAFHDPEEGGAHSTGGIAGVPPPESLPGFRDYVRDNAARIPPALARIHGHDFPIELRLPDPEAALAGRADGPARDYWLRVPSAAGIAEPRDHVALLAFLSDYWFAGTAGMMHNGDDGGGRRMGVATLNHSLWVHAAARVDEWLLFRTESPWAGQGRGLVRGAIHARDGRLIASAAQEASLRRV